MTIVTNYWTITIICIIWFPWKQQQKPHYYMHYSVILCYSLNLCTNACFLFPVNCFLLLTWFFHPYYHFVFPSYFQLYNTFYLSTQFFSPSSPLLLSFPTPTSSHSYSSPTSHFTPLFSPLSGYWVWGEESRAQRCRKEWEEWCLWCWDNDCEEGA